jgi:hypothetical protein
MGMMGRKKAQKAQNGGLAFLFHRRHPPSLELWRTRGDGGQFPPQFDWAFSSHARNRITLAEFCQVIS